jgi:GT2 family glycosyltransferase
LRKVGSISYCRIDANIRSNLKNVSIIIPNWNGRDLLAAYLESVVFAAERYRAEFKTEVEIILVDDASTDDSREWLRANYKEHPLVRVIELDSNLGFLRAVNRGFDEARYPIVLLLNSDVLVEADCIAPLAIHFESRDVFAVCCHADRMGTDRLDGGGKIGSFERGFWRVFRNYDVLPECSAEDLISFFGSGGYSAYDLEKWRQLGGFQECLSPNYWEDVEISYRAWKRGWKVLYESASVVNHLGSVSIGKSRTRAELDIVSERNRLLMTWINLHDRGKLASHFLWVFLKLLGSAVSLKWNFIRSFTLALQLFGSVRVARAIERKASVISDSELDGYFQHLVNRPEIHVLDTYESEKVFNAKKRSIAETDKIVG